MNGAANSGQMRDCGCCEGLSARTPVPVYNRPGLTALAYRIGTYTQFRQSLLARLTGAGHPALRGLTARDTSDFAVALLDAWAMVADVLTFYQERIANEAYLRTATERLSLTELAQLIGYEPGPGVAASTYLAFTLEDAPGAFGLALNLSEMARGARETLPPITIDIGTRVQSVPGPGEEPQMFETVERIEARAEWNAIKPRLTVPQELSLKMGSVVLQGTANNLHAGDAILIAVGSRQREQRTIQKVTTDEEANTTRIDFANPALSPATPSEQPWGNIDRDFPTKVPLTDTVLQKIIGFKWRETDLSALATRQSWSADQLVIGIAQQTSRQELAANAGLFVFRKQAALFGYNAVKQVTYDDKGRPKLTAQWQEWKPAPDEAVDRMFLDNPYDDLMPGGHIAIRKPDGAIRLLDIVVVTTRPRTEYGVSGKTTVLTLSEYWWNPGVETDFKVVRDSSVYIQSEPLALAQMAIDSPVEGDTVTLDRTYLGLRSGQKVIVVGERSDLRGNRVSEIRTLKQVVMVAGFSVVTFNQPLDHTYLRETMTLNANVALATQGEGAHEILGSGDANQVFQRFSLRQSPLTHVPAATPSGASSTLEVRVNDLLWHEVPTLYGHGPDERIYVISTDDQGKTTVLFGDGITGTRLPSGQNNVRAKYRKGMGLTGLLWSNQLSQLIAPPLGVKAATNPLAPTGAADRESLAEIRSNAPLITLTLNRIVSLQDYEDFARAFSGIEKASVIPAWIGGHRGVVLTIAGAKGAAVKRDSTLYQALRKAIAKVGDPTVPVIIHSQGDRGSPGQSMP